MSSVDWEALADVATTLGALDEDTTARINAVVDRFDAAVEERQAASAVPLLWLLQ